MKMRREILIYEVHLPSNLSLEEFEESLSILSDEELKVYKNYKVDHKKIEFIIGRLLIKQLISKELDIPISEVEIMKNKYGKLFLKKQCVHNEKESLHFNLSHTEGLVICVIGYMDQIGVDVENITYDFLEVMPQVFVPDEIKYINAGSSYETKLIRFFHLWTRKEALVKAKGLGFSLSPLSFRVPYQLDENTAEDFNYFTYSPMKDYVASVAVKNAEGIKHTFISKKICWKDLIK
ncbi:4'-phosphopantetheinyl transferase superfamily protein [Bacillus sp. 166amftsu]|uniref:4'-phosphopantetheinyl transferase family protein n=1 Tax=Bacillus sp. 166amftsu TaxID=1761753 RepID=UPI000899ACF8|nr:4'-phosphopantetheinyl transferase superfamily protein [Bacillus sp. 166amftsu]SDZ26956.1 4'-phosphopantetheinyl transferase [Bacillus sp. 166amftsu]